MYIIPPNFRHFITWLILLPMIVVESITFKGFYNQYLLNNSINTDKVVAEITEHREWHDNIIEIRYKFQVSNDQTWYSASEVLTKKQNLWMAITDSVWKDAINRGNLIEVIYLKDNPWVNKPISQAGIPMWDSLCLWSLIFAIDAYSLYEFIIIIRNYFYCQRAAERQKNCQLKYWKSEPF